MNKKFSVFIWTLVGMIGCMLLVMCFSVENVGAAANLPSQPPEVGPPVKGNFTINGYNPQQVDGFSNMQVISDGTTDKYESMWYKNPVDINKPFQTKFYIYMNGTADGMTFSLQGQGPTAIGTKGEGLGAYPDFRSSNFSSDTNYLHNALSLEFDPYFNADYSDWGLDKLWNGEYEGAHIAYTVPGESQSHFNPRGYNAIHYSPMKTSDLNNGKWHSIEVTWTPNGIQGTMSTKYDDKEMGSKTVNLSSFGNGKVFWGFTGSTGEQNMVGAVAYTEVIQEPKITKLVRNVTDGETEFKDNTSAKIGDKLEYKFVTENDRQNGLGNTWDQVTISDELPTGITTVDGGKSNAIINVGDIGVGESKNSFLEAQVVTNDNASLTNVATANGTNYYVSPTTLKSNDAVVNVKKVSEIKPVSLEVSDQIFNKTLGNFHNLDNTEINNVIAGDTVDYVTQIKNVNANSKLSKGTYTFKVPIDTKINSITINGEVLNIGNDFTVEKNADYQSVTINNITIIGISTTNIEINTTVGRTEYQTPFVTTPIINGTNLDGSYYSTNAAELSINYSTDLVTIAPQNIDYGSQVFVNNDQIINRTDKTNSPNSILNVNDSRRNKYPLKVFVSQDTPFKSLDDLDVILPSQLRYYKSGSFSVLNEDNPIEVEESKLGDSLGSVVWDKREGLLLYSNGSNFMPGRYQTTLTWTAVSGY